MEFLVASASKFVISVLEAGAQQLSSLAADEVNKLWNIDKNLQELLLTYQRIEKLIDGWEIGDGNSLETSLHKLEGYCYDTEDLVDDLRLTFEGEIERLKLRGGILKSPFKHWKVPHRIDSLLGDLDRLSKHIEGVLNAGQDKKQKQAPSAAANSYCSGRASLSDKTPLVPVDSRKQVKQSIITELTESSDDQQNGASGVAIIGMDGLGKTALARSILEDARIKKHFPRVLTACVSDDLHMEVLRNKLAAAESSHKRGVNLAELLGRRRTLLILDDVWSVTVEEWDRFKWNYLSSIPGWKVLTTTPNPKVAEVTRTTPCYLDTMTDEECKEVIMRRANLCAPDREIWDSDAEVIAKKCKGMPVFAGRLGLILSCKGSVDELSAAIQKLKNEHLQVLPQVEQAFHSLNLKNPYLKRCFAYFSLFSPKHKFNRDELIQLWEAEGFVQTQQRGGLQPTGAECFDKMLSRSVLKPRKPSSHEQTMYEIHDFTYEFAQKLASEAFCRIDEGTTTKFLASHNKSLRHLSSVCENIDVLLLEKVEKCTKLRTFLLLHQNGRKTLTISDTFFHKLERLRLLDLRHATISGLFKSRSPLKLLRYLDLSETDIQELPDSICRLRALQILKLEGCTKLARLPKDLNQLISLTHLHVNMRPWNGPPSYMGRLTNLEILSSYFVASNKGEKIAELKNMENLREIFISRLEKITDRNEAEESMLSTKKQLKRLVLEWDGPGAEMENAREILEGLKPHTDLKELVLRNYRGQQFPTWLSSSSQKLASVRLQKCQGCNVLPSLGQLPLLKNLVLHSIDNVEEVGEDFCGQDEKRFPRLESVEFREMRGLVSWTGLETSMPCLRTLKIIGCQRLIRLPSLIHQGCLIHMEINNCPVLESLPEIPSSMNSESGQLIIVDSPLVEERCQDGGADWPKIKDIPCKPGFPTTTASTTPAFLPPQNNERWMAMLNEGGCYYKPTWVVLLLVVTLISIVWGVVIRSAEE